VTFERGAIVGVPPGEPFAVFGPIYDEWVRQGGVGGALGYPTSDVVDLDPGQQQATFEHGTVTYDNATGATRVSLTSQA
jgi:uncharacterized protein with LGFP repeats